MPGISVPLYDPAVFCVLPANSVSSFCSSVSTPRLFFVSLNFPSHVSLRPFTATTPLHYATLRFTTLRFASLFAYFLLTPFRRFVVLFLRFDPSAFFLFRLTSLHRHHPASLRYASLLFFQSASLHFAGTALTLSSLTAPVAWGGTSFS